MKMTTTEPLTMKTKNGPKIFKPGDVFDVDKEKARPFIEKGLIKPIEGTNPIDAFKVEDFKKQNIAVGIRSAIVGEDFYLVSNESVRKHLKVEGLVCYLPEEIVHLRKISPEGIKTIHMIKKEFGGKTKVIK